MRLLSINVMVVFGVLLSQCRQPESVSDLATGGRTVGTLKGIEEINRQINKNLFYPPVNPSERNAGPADLNLPQSGGAKFDLLTLAGNEFSEFAQALGLDEKGSTRSEFRGGDPTPFSILIYQQLFSRFAVKMALSCDKRMLQNLPEDEFELQQEMLNTALLSSAVGSIAQACRSKDANELKGHLDGLWDILYAFEDVEERDKVVAGVLDLYAKDSTMRGAAIIETFMLAATLNPYFLLVK